MTVSVVADLLRQLLAGLLRRDVLGVPVRPVRIPHAGPLLVLAVRGLGAAERAARSATEANVVWFGSTRPGSRAVTSCNSQPLPSGSLNEAYER